MKHIIYIVFVTKNSPYEEIAREKIEPSLKKFKLNYEIKVVPNLNNWYKNVAQKPKIISEYLLDTPFQYDVVMLDADCIIEKQPTLFLEIPEEYDIAFHTLNWQTWYNYKDSKVRELLTGTMLFRNRPKVRELCKEWYDKASKSNEWEQKVLSKIINKYELNIYPLPIEYCYIDTLPDGRKPFISDKGVVIKHFQASREWKRKLQMWDMLKNRKK